MWVRSASKLLEGRGVGVEGAGEPTRTVLQSGGGERSQRSGVGLAGRRDKTAQKQVSCQAIDARLGKPSVVVLFFGQPWKENLVAGSESIA